jgi:hypothetical protein
VRSAGAVADFGQGCAPGWSDDGGSQNGLNDNKLP